MNDKELIGKVHSSMYHQLKRKGYATAVDVLMDLEILSKTDYELWRNGKVLYLEKVCKVNLKKLSTILHEMRVYAKKGNLKPSFCVYKRWAVKKKNGQGKKPVIKLRFSKSGSEDIEKWYATHFVDTKKIEKIKEENHAFNISMLDITGKDLMNLGIPKGPKIGEILEDLLKRVIEEPKLNNKELLVDIAKKE